MSLILVPEYATQLFILSPSFAFQPHLDILPEPDNKCHYSDFRSQLHLSVS